MSAIRGQVQGLRFFFFGCALAAAATAAALFPARVLGWPAVGAAPAEGISMVVSSDPAPGINRVAAVGVAGESGSALATVSNDGRHAGRGGVGCVLGAKQIKAAKVGKSVRISRI